MPAMPDSRFEAAPAEAVTVRSLVVGSVLVVLADLYINWAVLVLRASKLNKSYFPMGLFFVFAVLVWLNARSGRRGRPFLSRPEMLVSLAMGLIGSFFPFFGLAGFVVGVIAAPYYFATSENGWAETLHPHVEPWIALTDEDLAATWFYEGIPPGAAIPWGSWAVPTLWWAVLVGAAAWSILCLMVLMRKQWVEHERLEYPLMAVGMRVAEPSTYANAKGFRLGLAIGFAAVAWNVATYFAPVLPELPTVPTAGSWQKWVPGAPTFWVQFSIYILGFAYFARVEALLSFWLFFVLTGIEISVFDRLGVGVSVGQGGVEAVRSQSFGALVTLAAVSLYSARGHLVRAFRKATGRASELSDADEVLSYRTALIGLPVGVALMFGWLSAAGIEAPVVSLYLLFAFAAYLGLSCVVAEVGLPYANISDTALNWTPLYILGARSVQASSLVGLGYFYALFATTRGFLGPPIAQALRLSTGLTFRRYRMLLAIGLALALGFFVSVGQTVYLGNVNGGYNLGAWSLINGSPRAYQTAATWIRNPKPPDLDRLTFMASGIVVTLLLTVLKYRVMWWPLPAVGLALQGMYMARRIVFPVFLAWGIKSVILKVGGVGLYRRGQPFVIGLMIGYAVAVFLSTGIDHVFFWGRGHSVHDF